MMTHICEFVPREAINPNGCRIKWQASKDFYMLASQDLTSYSRERSGALGAEITLGNSAKCLSGAAVRCSYSDKYLLSPNISRIARYFTAPCCWQWSCSSLLQCVQCFAN